MKDYKYRDSRYIMLADEIRLKREHPLLTGAVVALVFSVLSAIFSLF